MFKPIRAVLYSRVSTVMQAEGGVSLEMQEDLARRHCEREGWEFVGSYTDTMSGTKDSRVQLAQMEADAAARPRRFDIILVYKTDRLARSLLKLLQLAAGFNDCGVALVSLTEPIDFTTPMGKGMLALLGTFAEMESQNIASRVRDSLRVVAAQGGSTGAFKRALGYRWDKEACRYVVQDDEAATVKAIYEAYLRLRTYRSVAAEMNERGLRTIDGKTFSVQAVRWILQNPIYKGTLVWGRTTSKKNSRGARRAVNVPEERWVTHENAHEAIIGPEMWAMVQGLAAANSKLSARAVYGRANYAWSGSITCSGCGGPAVRFNAGGKPRNDGSVKRITGYECLSRKNKGHKQCDSACYLTDVFLDEVAIPALAELLAGNHAERPKGQRRKAAPARSHAAEIDALKLEIENIWKAWAKGRISEAAAQDVEDKARAKIQELTAASQVAAPAVVPLPRIANFLQAWQTAGEAARGDLLRLYVERVTADKGEVRFHFHPTIGLEPLCVERVSLRGNYGRKMKGQARPW